jgi:hypothetical protein
MLLLEARRDLSRTVLTVCLGYVLALHLIIAGLASTSQTVRSLDALLSLDPHAFCLSGAAGESSDEGRSQPLGPHHHDLCCTLACGVALFAPTAFATIAFAARTTTVVHSTRDFGARPSTAPPGLGQGPRAPPTDLV